MPAISAMMYFCSLACRIYSFRQTGWPALNRQSATLKVAFSFEIGRIGNENLLYLLGLADEFAPHRQKRRDYAAHVRSGHAGAACFDILALLPLCAFFLELSSGTRDDFFSRGNKVGF